MRAWQAATPQRDSRAHQQDKIQEERLASEQQGAGGAKVEIMVVESPQDAEKHDNGYEYIDPRRIQSPTRRSMGNMERRHFQEDLHMLPSDGGLAGDMGEKFCDVWDTSHTPLKSRRRSGKRADHMSEILSGTPDRSAPSRHGREWQSPPDASRREETRSSLQKDRDHSDVQHAMKSDVKMRPYENAREGPDTHPTRNKGERLRSILRIQDSTCSGSVDWQDFKFALHEAGIQLNAQDTTAMWQKSGGSIDGNGSPLGRTSIDTILQEVSGQNHRRSEFKSSEKAYNEGRRYSAHMQSNLTTGMAVNHSASEFECTGGGMKKGRLPISYAWQHGSLNSGVKDRQFLEVQHLSHEYDTMARWTKNESKLKDDFLLKRNQIKRLFSTETEEPKSLGFEEFRNGIKQVGIIVSDHDCERIWRRVDKECLGQVSFDQMVNAFDLTGREASARTSLSTQNHGKDVNSPVILRKLKEDHDPNKLSTDKVSLSIVNDAPRGSILKSLQKSLNKQRITQRDFSDALASAGLVVNQTDCNELYKRAGGGIMRPYVSMENIEEAILSASAVQKPGADVAIFCFSSKEGMYHRESNPHPQEGSRDALLTQACQKLTSGCLKNPHRLVQVFKKFDVDRLGFISRMEFERGLLSHGISLSPGDIQRLSMVDRSSSCSSLTCLCRKRPTRTGWSSTRISSPRFLPCSSTWSRAEARNMPLYRVPPMTPRGATS